MIWMYGLIIVGLLFLFFEIFFVPGTTLVGLLGMGIAAFGIYRLYTDHTIMAGTLGLAITVLGFFTLLAIGFRQQSWKQYAIEDSLKGKTNVVTEDEVTTGDTGKAVSAIKPAGKARINGGNYEVQAYSDFIDDGEPVTVTKVRGKTIYVRRATNPEA